MLASKLCRIPITSFVSGIGRPLNKPQLCMRTRTQQLASDSRSGATRRAQRTRISLEKLTTPAGETGKRKLNIHEHIGFKINDRRTIILFNSWNFETIQTFQMFWYLSGITSVIIKKLCTYSCYSLYFCNFSSQLNNKSSVQIHCMNLDTVIEFIFQLSLLGKEWLLAEQH